MATKIPNTHSGKVCAQARSGFVNVRDGYFKDGQGFAVDVRVDGTGASSHYPKGVVTRFYNTKAEATAFANEVNAGGGGSWYTKRNARGAIVVPAYNVPVGKSAADVLAAAAKPRKPRSRKGGASASAPALPQAPAASAPALPATPQA